jgi:hypothetical protein
MTPFNLGIVGTCAQAAAVPAPSGLRILDFDATDDEQSGNTDAVNIQENVESITSPFSHDGSGFSSGQYTANINIGALNTAYSGEALAATLEFGGFLNSTASGGMPSGTTYLWDVATGSSTSLSNGTASISGTASTAQNSLDFSGTNNGIGEKAVLTFGGGKGGIVLPSPNDVWHIEVTCTATSAGGSATANLDIEYTFVL